MRVPLGWLREYVDLPQDAAAIAERLAMLGFPVDSIETRPPITGVVVGKIVALEKHPNADRLQVARIDAGGDRPLTVATAATNVATGQTIAVATIGAQLPQLKIEPRKMRGIASEGMMISAEELALPREWFEDGILQLEPDRQSGSDVVALFGLDDPVLDVEITSNRVDAMSMIGLARELAASYGVALRLPSLENPGTGEAPVDEDPSVAIETPDCLRFVAQRFDGITVGTAPAWMRVRLALAGQRPIDSIVDVSNYVMLETGQPLHFYDAARIDGDRLIVRDARDGERLTTLDGVERTLEPSALVIADTRRALGLAGVMGGADSEVRAGTTSIVLESASFDGTRVRRTAKALGLRSEASSRHEKSPALALADMGAARAAQFLQALGARAYAPRAFGNGVRPAEAIVLRAADVARLLGMALAPERIASHLTALGCSVFTSGQELSVTPPPWRNDLAIVADLIEEVARMEGYDRIEAVEPAVPAHAISSAAFERENAAAHALAALGYREIVGHSLHGAQPLDKSAKAGLAFDAPLEVLNPLSEDQRYLRA
ncbi:MAG TPA: phenylalanine--tRNA ligase subunit beta, partial [Candidatus Tumulicola sp.]|nr:phenylalanine--tRNA ligase subunit beta [Candidatus Tumulicola sp.]